MTTRVSSWRAGPRVALVLTLASLVHPLATELAPWCWWADLITPFLEPAAVIALLGSAANLVWGRRLWAFCLLSLSGLELSACLRYDDPRTLDVASASLDQRLKVLVVNVQSANQQYQEVANLIGREEPEVVGLIEVTPDWIAGLEEVRRTYPHRVESPDGARGLALWSQRRFLKAEPPFRVTARGYPALRVELPLADRPLVFWLVHPPAPIWITGRLPHSNPDIAALGRRIGRDRGSRLVVGDLNRADGSPYFWAFVRDTGLRDSRFGFGRQASWPTWSPYRIAIDHAFVSDDLVVIDRRLGPDVGSDHFPVLIELAPTDRDRRASAERVSASQTSE